MSEKKMVRIAFELTEDEVDELSSLRCEPKPSTAAAQVVRLALRQKTEDGK